MNLDPSGVLAPAAAILPRLRAWLRGWLRSQTRVNAAALAASALLGTLAVYSILKECGQPGLALDDSFIHFVFARNLAHGHPFAYGHGEQLSSGSTSFIWPILLSVCWLLGLDGLQPIWIVWVIGTLLHAAVAVETMRLAEGLVCRSAALGAMAMCLLFGAFCWFAWSGMETMALAWCMTRSLRTASEWIEAPRSSRTAAAALSLGGFGALAPLVRPEGALTALAVAIILFTFPSSGLPGWRRAHSRVAGLLPVAAVALVPVINWALVGHARATTTMVKWAIGNPYLAREQLWQFFRHNARMLIDELLSGGLHTALFMPEQGQWAILLGFSALVPAAIRSGRAPRAALVGLLALGTLVPCTFLTMLWNHVRYIWPFAPAWFVLVACLANEVAGLAAKATQRDTWYVPALLTGAYAALLGAKLPLALADLGKSARAITQQQVELGLWARDHLPADAHIGINDAGAIAYFSERRTFDVVGLTTEGEAPYWVAGPGSRYEHYEALGQSALPTHFIIYPQWFEMPSVLGRRIHDATVLDQTILGDATMVAFEADWRVLGRAARPVLRPHRQAPLDELDVADLESERAHAYELGITTGDDNRVISTFQGGAMVSDGARSRRKRERFILNFAHAHRPILVARLATTTELDLHVSVDGVAVASSRVSGRWVEVEVPLPPGMQGPATIEVRAAPPATFSALHYWVFDD